MRRLDDERGAVAVFVAILLVVLFGMSALVIDVGNMYWERRQLQNGADAAALAIAADCAEGIVSCASAGAPVLGGVAGPYANSNANDSESGVPELMAHGSSPASCEPGSDDAPNPLADSETVKVSTETIDAATGNSFLTHWFASIIDAAPTKTVSACAVAGWGNPSETNVVPLTFSYCEWEDILPSGTETIYFHTASESETNQCDGPAGQDTPGGFGWLDPDDSGTCSAFITADQEADGKTGSGVPTPTNDTGCDAAFWESLLGETILVPIFSGEPGPSGSNATYHIEGFAALELEGYRLGGAPEFNSSPSPCSGDSRCIRGNFVEYIDFGDADLGGEDFGVTSVTLIG